jgi:hypothetical protein
MFMKKYIFLIFIFIAITTHAMEKQNGYLISQNPIQQKALHKLINERTNWHNIPIYRYKDNKLSREGNNIKEVDIGVINDIQKAMIEDKIVFCTFFGGLANALLYDTKDTTLCSQAEEYEKMIENFDRAFPGMG